MDDSEVLARIRDLVSEEHELRAHPGSVVDDQRVRDIEERLDQCWDLLRQRRARRDAGESPGEAHVRSVDTVENYRQ